MINIIGEVWLSAEEAQKRDPTRGPRDFLKPDLKLERGGEFCSQKKRNRKKKRWDGLLLEKEQQGRDLRVGNRCIQRSSTRREAAISGMGQPALSTSLKLCCLRAERPWVTDLTSLSLCFLIL